LLFRRQQPATLKPIILYLWVAFILNLAIDIYGFLEPTYPDWTNNPLYNIHSVVRFCLLQFLFHTITANSFTELKKPWHIFWYILTYKLSFFENFLTMNLSAAIYSH
jgi:hypothetical protein